MKAIAMTAFGGPEVLSLAEVPVPEPGPGQIRVRVRAAGVNPIDGKIRRGDMERAFHTPLPAILGIDVAGTVDALGDGVTDVAVGDRVLGSADAPAGSYAEFALATRYVTMPDDLDFQAAVALPVAVETATRTLSLLQVGAGDTLLIHGASGSVGQIVVQLAIERGATVIGTASEANQDRVRELGAIPTVYGPGLVERVRALAPDGVDAVLDVSGKGALPDSIELRGGTDRIVTIADDAAAQYGVVFTAGVNEPTTEGLGAAADRLARHDLIATIAAVFPFADVAEAHRLSDSGHAGGKIVLVP